VATTHPDERGISVPGIIFVVLTFPVLPVALSGGVDLISITFTFLALLLAFASSADPISVGDCGLLVLIECCGEGTPKRFLTITFHTITSVQAGLDGIDPGIVQVRLATAFTRLAVKGDSFVCD